MGEILPRKKQKSSCRGIPHTSLNSAVLIAHFPIIAQIHPSAGQVQAPRIRFDVVPDSPTTAILWF
jgi:hypothetical protein